MCSLPRGHSCSLMSHCTTIGAWHTERVLACVPPFPFPHWVSDSTAPPGLSQKLELPRQLWCKPAAWHFSWHGMAWLGLAQQSHGGTGRACFVPWSRAAASVCFVVCWKLVFLCAQGFLWLPGGMLGLGGGFCSWKCCMITTLVFGNLLELPIGISISIWCHRWRLLPRSGNNIS